MKVWGMDVSDSVLIELEDWEWRVCVCVCVCVCLRVRGQMLNKTVQNG